MNFDLEKYLRENIYGYADGPIDINLLRKCQHNIAELMQGLIRPGGLKKSPTTPTYTFDSDRAKGTIFEIKGGELEVNADIPCGGLVYYSGIIFCKYTDETGFYVFESKEKSDSVHVKYYDVEAIEVREEAQKKAGDKHVSFDSLGIKPDIEKDVELTEEYDTPFKLINAFIRNHELVKEKLKSKKL